MKLYLLSLGAGLMVGIIYSVINVRSPAPPLIALLGLLGMLGGEQVIPGMKQVLAASTTASISSYARCLSDAFGFSSRRSGAEAEAPTTKITRTDESANS
jgi:XapX domain-containing protein